MRIILILIILVSLQLGCSVQKSLVIESKDKTIKKIEVNLKQIREKKIHNLIFNEYLKYTNWPSEKEKVKLIADNKDIEKNIPYFIRCLNLILNSKSIPENVKSLIYGLKRYKGNDTLFLEYKIGHSHFRIAESPYTVRITIKSKEFPKIVKDWPGFINSVIEKFFSNDSCKKLIKYSGLSIVELPDVILFRIGMSYKCPENNDIKSIEIWQSGNLHRIWYCDQKITFIISKRFGVALHPHIQDFGYGKSQRFPPLKDVLKNKNCKYLGKYISNFNHSIWERCVAEEEMRVRLHENKYPKNKLSQAIEPLINGYVNNRELITARIETSIIHILNDISVSLGNPWSENIKAFYKKELNEKNLNEYNKESMEKLLKNNWKVIEPRPDF